MTHPVLEFVSTHITLVDNVFSIVLPPELMDKVSEVDFKVKPIISKDTLTWVGAEALYMIESIWPLVQKQYAPLSFEEQFGLSWQQLQTANNVGKTLQVQKMLPEAVIPAKAHPLDTGYDLTIIRVVNPSFGPGVILYGTGLIARPPDGFYIDTVARSSLCKQGWGIANSVGIIDAQYRGELCIPLFRLHPNAKELELPARIGQMVIRPLYLCHLEEVEDVGQTQRGAGGFGSSGK